MKSIIFRFVLTILVLLGSTSAVVTAHPQDDPMRQLKLEQIPGVPQLSDNRFEMLAFEGQKLTSDEALKLEERILSTPNDLQARARLLGYYVRQDNLKIGKSDIIAARRRHILWIIEHRPQSDALALPDALISPANDPLADPVGYQQGRDLWIQAAVSHPEDPKVLYNAAWFFHVYDKPRAEQITLEGMQLEPDSTDWKFLLGTIYVFGVLGVNQIRPGGDASGFDPAEASGPFANSALQKLQNSQDAEFLAMTGGMFTRADLLGTIMVHGGKLGANFDAAGTGESLLKRAAEMDPGKYGFALGRSYEMKAMTARDPKDRKALMQKALSFEEPMLKKSGPMDGLFVPMVCETAMGAEDYEKAESCAKRLLSDAESGAGMGLEDSELQTGHTILGRIALQRGHMEDAKRELLDSGRVKSNPPLMSFGPSMMLAKALLEKGERETVLAYLDLCAKFWEMGQDQLVAWKKTIQEGGTPDFGVNGMR